MPEIGLSCSEFEMMPSSILDPETHTHFCTSISVGGLSFAKGILEPLTLTYSRP